MMLSNKERLSIEQLLHALRDDTEVPYDWRKVIRNVVAALVASDVERARALERLQQNYDGVAKATSLTQKAMLEIMDERDALRAEVERLTRERDGLKAELTGAYEAGHEAISDLTKALEDAGAALALRDLSVRNLRGLVADLEEDLATAQREREKDEAAHNRDDIDRLTRERDEAQAKLTRCGQENCMGWDGSEPDWAMVRWVREERLIAARGLVRELAEALAKYRHCPKWVDCSCTICIETAALLVRVREVQGRRT